VGEGVCNWVETANSIQRWVTWSHTESNETMAVIFQRAHGTGFLGGGGDRGKGVIEIE